MRVYPATKFVIWTNYGLDGWQPTHGAETLEDAIKARDESLSFGNAEVVITKAVKLSFKEIE